MDKYTIYCTEEQTKKALELGAPIEKVGISQRDPSRPVYYTDDPKENWESDAYYCPTAEQMIRWLEEQGIFIEVSPSFNEDGTHLFIYHIGSDIDSWIDSELKHIAGELLTYPSRKEATIAAIDAALDYLIKIKD